MKNYTSPKLISIPLDPYQAVLQSCQVGGEYFAMSTQCNGSNVTSFVAVTCQLSVRGLKTQITDGITKENIPS